MTVTRKNRPGVPADWPQSWLEVEILPFDARMARIGDGGWLQWAPSECVPISALTYCLLGIVWPLLRLLYRRPLAGQSTDSKAILRRILPERMIPEDWE